MVDVADVLGKRILNNFSLWEDELNPLAPITSDERDSIIEVSSAANLRPFVLKGNKISLTLSSLTSSNFSSSRLCQASGIGDPDKFNQQGSNEVEQQIEKHTLNQKENLTDINKYDISEARLVVSKIDSSQQFLNWFASIEDEMEKQQDTSYHDYVSQLKDHRKECQALLDQLNYALDNLKYLSDQYTSVSSKTSALHTDCEHLLADQTRLSNGGDTIESKISYFTQVDKISQKLSSPTFKVSSDGFIPLLAKIDECIIYLKNNSTFLESSNYLAKYNHCLSRALSMVKLYVNQSFEKATMQVLPVPGAEKPTSDNALILYYGKFRTNAPRIKALMVEIEDRVDGSREYSNLLSDCHHCYFIQRKCLLEPCVQDAISQLFQKYTKDYCSLLRCGCAFLVHVCEDEHNLFYQFFSVYTSDLEEFLHGLCSCLYDTLRPLIIHIDHLQTLSEMCTILRRGMIEEYIQNNPMQLASLTKIVSQLLEDCQERLVYRVNIYMETDIEGFKPSPGDLAYPSKLEMMENIAISLAKEKVCSVSSKNGSISSMTSVRTSVSESPFGEERSITRVGSSPADLHGMWYPTVRRTLMCLSKVYRCVDRSIFQGVSLEALGACVNSLTYASRSIRNTSTDLDADLFEIKHLLILREQMAPFQVTEQLLDSKRDIDKHLKGVCERLISSCSQSLVEPMSKFMSRVELILQMNNEENVKSIVLKNQPFATAEKVCDVLSLSKKNLRRILPYIQRSLQLYLANRDTEYILFKPIRTNILNSFSKIKKIVDENYDEEDRTIIAAPIQEEVSALISSIFQVGGKE